VNAIDDEYSPFLDLTFLKYAAGFTFVRGCSPLLCTIYHHGKPDVSQLLLHHKADVSKIDDDEYYPVPCMRF
jgi:hypothetical protein